MAEIITRALVADAHFLTSSGIAEILHHHVDIAEVACAADFRQVCALLADDASYCMITLDLALPELGGLDGVRFLRTEYPALKIVIVSDQAHNIAMLTALAAGIHGYILKDMDAPAMIDAFKQVLNGKIFVPSCMSEVPALGQAVKAVAVDETDISLTARQRDVVQYLRKGMSNKEIARALNISESTVKVHMAAAFRQLGVHNRVGVIAVLDGQMTGRSPQKKPFWPERRRAVARA